MSVRRHVQPLDRNGTGGAAGLSHHGESGRLGRQRDWTGRRQTFGRDAVVPPMPVASTGLALFLDVRDFPTGRHFAITANHATAGESGEAEKPNETHTILR